MAKNAEWLRRLNVRLLDWMVGEFIAVPRRAAVRVVEALNAEMPGLSCDPHDQGRIASVGSNADFQRGVFGRDAVPRTWKQAASAPNFAPFNARCSSMSTLSSSSSDSVRTSGWLIPATLNLHIASLQMLSLLALLWGAVAFRFWPWTPLLAVGYALVMNSAYLMLHEAEHGLLHPRRGINDAAGALLALFFPAPFHLLRQGHLGHHVRNRTDDEAFDHYFPNKVFWKHWAFYNILTGGFWLCIALSNSFSRSVPTLVRHVGALRSPHEALLESLNPRL